MLGQTVTTEDMEMATNEFSAELSVEQIDWKSDIPGDPVFK